MSSHRVEAALGLVILALAAVLAVAAPRFFEPANLADLVLANLPVLIAAIGATLVILTGEIDISVGSTFAVCSVVAGTLATLGAPMPAVVVGRARRRCRDWRCQRPAASRGSTFRRLS